MTGIVRSELVRLRRRSMILGWLGLTAVFAILINMVMFQVVEPGSPAPADGAGVRFPSAQELLSPSGLVAGLPTASSFFGVVTLSFWALAAASDYDTGLIRIIVAAQPRRWRLLVGKWVALAVGTGVATVLALVVSLGAAPLGAQAGGWSTDAWGNDAVSLAARAALDLYAALLVWGSLGLALALLTRSAGVAIGAGIGYVLLVEAVIGATFTDLADWLPGATLGALAAGGNDTLSHGAALALGLAYIVVAIGAAWWVFTRRDITD